MATITALPTPPTRSDPVNFATRADDFLSALPAFGSEANNLADEVNSNKTIAVNSATSATASASSATASAASATASATSATTSATNANASATSATASATSATASLNSFNIRYLGSKTSDPTLDNQGNALTTGATYWNSTANSLRYWNGTAWATPVETAVTSAADAQTAFVNFSARYLGARSTQPSNDNFGQPLIAGASYWNTIENTLYIYLGPGGSGTGSWQAPVAIAVNAKDLAQTAQTNAQSFSLNASNSAIAAANSAAAAAGSASAAAGSATVATDAAADVNETYIDFSAKYLGSKTSEPSVDNAGAPLTEGAIYWNSTLGQLYVRKASTWEQAAFSVTGAVTSFNTRTGSITLNSGDVTGVLNSADVTVNNLNATSAIRINNNTVIDSTQNWVGPAITVSNGGTGASTLTGVLVGNGTSAVTTKTAPAGEIVGTSDSQTLSNKVLVNVREVYQAMAGNNIDLAAANYFTKTITTATTFTVTNVPISGQVAAFILELTNPGSQAITWFANTRWANGAPPLLTNSGSDILGFFTFNGGASWTAVVVARDVR
jgi:hypothetical protein